MDEQEHFARLKRPVIAPLVSNTEQHESMQSWMDRPNHPTLDYHQETSFLCQNFSRVAAQTNICSVGPRRCQFGETCHSCPAHIQAKMKINQLGDEYEQEANRVAELVLRMDNGDKRIQQRQVAKPSGSVQAPEIVNETIRSPGRPLDIVTRTFMESRFGQDFSQVRVHTGPLAEQSAKSINALAYTLGTNIVFREGCYSPGSQEGKKLLSHELAHVLQQGALLSSKSVDRFVQKKADEPRLCGGMWTCAATPCSDSDPGMGGRKETASSWTLKVMIDVEAPSAADVTGSTVGHTYVEFSDSTSRTYAYGFYPNKARGTPDPLFRPIVAGCVVHPDTNHKACVDYVETFSLTPEQFNDALSFAQSLCEAPPRYNLQEWNCTTFAVEVAKKAGKILPPVRGRIGGSIGTTADNPYKLYKGLMQRDIGPTYTLSSDTEIRNAINGSDPATIAKIPLQEKVRVIQRLFDGWVSGTDIRIIKKVYLNTSSEEKLKLRQVIEPRIPDLIDIGQRIQVRAVLAGEVD